MSRRRKNRFGISGDYTSTSARWKLCRKPTRWREGMTGRRVLTGLRSKPSKKVERRVFSHRFGLVANTYRPMQARKREISKDGARKFASVPAFRDRVVQGALKLTLEPIFEDKKAQ
jgi:hypothetical protein